MNPEKEAKLQKILKILTVGVGIFTLALAVTLFDFSPKASVLNATEEVIDQVLVEPTALPRIAPPPHNELGEEANTLKKRKKVPRLPRIPKEEYAEQIVILSPEAQGDQAFLEGNFTKAEKQYELSRSIQDSTFLRIKHVRSLLAQRKIIEAQTVLDNIPEDLYLGLQLYRGILKSLFNEPEKSKILLKKVAEFETKEVLEKRFVKKARGLLKAYEEWDFTVDGRPEHLQAMIAKALNEIGEFELAIAMSLDAIKTQNDYRDAWVVLGHSYIASNQFLEAESALEKAIRLDSKHAEAHFYLSFAKRGLEKFGPAYESLKKSQDLGIPRNLFFKEHEAILLDKTNRLREALGVYLNVLNEKGESAQPEEYVRPLYFLLDVFGMDKEGLALAKRVENYYPKNAMSYNFLGWAQLASGNTFEASKALKEALTLDPTIPAIYLTIGRVHEKQGNLERAEDMYKRSIEIAEEREDKEIQEVARARLKLVEQRIELEKTSTSNNS